MADVVASMKDKAEEVQGKAEDKAEEVQKKGEEVVEEAKKKRSGFLGFLKGKPAKPGKFRKVNLVASYVDAYANILISAPCRQGEGFRSF
jgi:hypothetical protein